VIRQPDRVHVCFRQLAVRRLSGRRCVFGSARSRSLWSVKRSSGPESGRYCVLTPAPARPRCGCGQLITVRMCLVAAVMYRIILVRQVNRLVGAYELVRGQSPIMYDDVENSHTKNQSLFR